MATFPDNMLTPKQIVRSDVRIHEAPLRNRTFLLNLGDSELGKCIKIDLSMIDDISSISEAAVYRHIYRAGPDLARVLPCHTNAGGKTTTLITKLIAGAVTLREYCAAGRLISVSLTTALGRALMLVHRCEPLPVNNVSNLLGPSPVSWISQPNVSTSWTLSPGTRKLAAAIQQEVTLLDLILHDSQHSDGTAFVHNDLKWDNILVHPGEGETEPTEVKIIDWEMAGIGDPCWDVGTVLSEFVAFWALSIPVVDGEPYEGLAKYPIEDMQPAIRAFWESYAGAMEFDWATARERLIKSVRFAGARLIQTAHERTQTMTYLTPHIYLLLQLSLNIMEGPEDAAEALFGIPLPGGVGA